MIFGPFQQAARPTPCSGGYGEKVRGFPGLKKDSETATKVSFN